MATAAADPGSGLVEQGPVEHLVAVADSVRYRVLELGAGPTLVLLHGFTGSAASWSDLLHPLAVGRRVLAPDLLGHGATDAPGDWRRYAAASQVADLDRVISEFASEPVALLGYSMGARLALAFAANHPDRVSAVALESGSPGILREAERAARRASDAALALTIERDGVAAFVDAWESLPLWQSQQAVPFEVRARQRAIRLGNPAVGLSGSLRGFGQGSQPPLHDALPRLASPLLAVAGSLDRRYVEIAGAMATAAPRGEEVVIPDAGHAPHLERPEAFVEAVRRFLDRHHPRNDETD